jgi:hypothetical protein
VIFRKLSAIDRLLYSLLLAITARLMALGIVCANPATPAASEHRRLLRRFSARDQPRSLRRVFLHQTLDVYVGHVLAWGAGGP